MLRDLADRRRASPGSRRTADACDEALYRVYHPRLGRFLGLMAPRRSVVEEVLKGAHEYLGEAYLQAGDLERAERELRALDSICFTPCEQYSDLKEQIRRRKSEHPAPAARLTRGGTPGVGSATTAPPARRASAATA